MISAGKYYAVSVSGSWAPYLKEIVYGEKMSLPSEKVQELKQIIHSHLSQMNVHSRIKEYVGESFRGDDLESRGIDETGLLNALKERGIVDDVMKTLKFEGIEREPRRSKDKERVESLEEIPTRGNTVSCLFFIS